MNINKKWITISVVSFVILYWMLEAGDGWSFWGAVFLGWVFSRNKNKDHASEKNILTKKEYSSPQESLDQTKQSEAKRIRDLAEKKKEQAMKSGIPQLVDGLYHDSIHYYPSWIKHASRDSVPEIVTDAREINDKKSGDKYLLLIMNGREYKFTHSEGSYEDIYWGDLQMFLNNERVLHVNEGVSYNEWGTDYLPNSVDAFIEGDWANDFEELKDQIKKAEEERKRKEFENPGDIEKLKKSFGIE